MADVTFTFTGDTSNLQDALKGIKDEIGKARESVKGLAGQFTAAFAAIGTAIATVKGAFSTIGNISSEAARMEQTALAFRVMMRDAEAAAEYVDKLRVYAAETPFEFGDISDAGKTLLSMGTAADKSIEVIRKLGDIASVSGKPLRELAFLYAKVQNSGLSNEVAESLEMQGVPIRKLIAEMKGITFEDVFKGISKREFNLDDLDAALDKLTGSGGLLENMTKLQSQTFSGALSTLTDGFTALAVELGTPVNAALLPVLADLTAYVDSVTPAVREFGQTLASVLSGAVENISPLASGIGSVVSALGGMKTVVASVAAGLLLMSANTKAATASTFSLRASVASLSTTLRGLSWASVGSAFKAALAGMRGVLSSTLASMRGVWSAAWSTMASVARASMLAVKTAIVSTGIGLILVGIGEALGALYNWFMGVSEGAKEAAASAREFEQSLQRMEKQAGKVQTQEQYDAFMEELQDRIDELQGQRDDAAAGGEEERAEQLAAQVYELEEQRARYQRILPMQIQAAQEEQKRTEELRRQAEEAAELEKKLEDARKKMADLVAKQHEHGREAFLSGLDDTRMEIDMRLSDAGFKTIEDLEREIARLEKLGGKFKLGDEARYEKLCAVYNKLIDLKRKDAEETRKAGEEERKRDADAAKRRQEVAINQQEYDMKVKILRAEISGNEQKLQILKAQQRITELTLQYQREGLADAEAAAKRMVALEMQAEDRRSRHDNSNTGRGRDSGTRISSSLASVGGGGRSVLIGGSLVTETKKHTKLLEAIRAATSKPPTVQVSGNVDAVIGR